MEETVLRGLKYEKDIWPFLNKKRKEREKVKNKIEE